MKNFKSILFCLITLAISGFSSAQQDQVSALEAIGNGSTFKGYWGVEITGGKTSGQARSYQFELQMENDVPDRGDAFMLNKEGTTSAKINSGFGYLEANHHTKPSAFRIQNKKSIYVYINGILYFLENASDPTNLENLKIDELFVLMNAANTTEDLSGKAALKDMKIRDHIGVIKKYLTDMIVIQADATSNFTDKENDEIAIIAQAKIDKKAGIQAKNAAYWNSPEGQRVLAKSRQAEITLVNDTDNVLLLCYGQGVSSELDPGQSKKFSCTGTKVYRGTRREGNSSQYDATDNVLLIRGGNNCGAVINASTVIR